MIRRWSASGDAALAQALRAPTNGRLTLTVGLVAEDGHMLAESVRLDLTQAWASGLLPLKIDSVECSTPCRLGGALKLNVPGFTAWKSSTQTSLDKVALVIDQARLPGLVPRVAPAGDRLEFSLQRLDGNADSGEAWEQLLPTLIAGDGKFSAGLSDDKALNLGAGDRYAYFVATSARALCMVLGLVALIRAPA